VIANARQIARNLAFPRFVACGLLDDDPLWPRGFGDAPHFRPHGFACAFALDGCCKAGALAWWAAGEKVKFSKLITS
jgi:hypothetical protein